MACHNLFTTSGVLYLICTTETEVETRDFIYLCMKVCANFRCFFISWTQRMDMLGALIWKEKCFLNHCQGKGSHQPIHKASSHIIRPSFCMFVFWFLSSNTVRLPSNNRHTPVILSSRFRRVMVKPSSNSGQIEFTLTCIWALSSKISQWNLATG